MSGFATFCVELVFAVLRCPSQRPRRTRCRTRTPRRRPYDSKGRRRGCCAPGAGSGRSSTSSPYAAQGSTDGRGTVVGARATPRQSGAHVALEGTPGWGSTSSPRSMQGSWRRRARWGWHLPPSRGTWCLLRLSARLQEGRSEDGNFRRVRRSSLRQSWDPHLTSTRLIPLKGRAASRSDAASGVPPFFTRPSLFPGAAPRRGVSFSTSAPPRRLTRQGATAEAQERGC